MAAQAHAIVSPKLQNIILTTDFSSCSDTALIFARGIARLYDSAVHVVHVVPPEPLVVGEFGFAMPDVTEQQDNEKKATDDMARLLQSEQLQGVRCTQRIEKGEIADVVARLSDTLQADLIVMGTHGRHGLKHMMIGSVAEQIFRHATCPVLTVGPEIQRDGLASGRLDTILFATDFSPASRHALDYAVLLSRPTSASIAMLHVVNDSEATVLALYDRPMGIIRDQLARMMTENPSVTYSVSVEAGTPADVIIEKASETDAGLIVMGAHRGAVATAHAPWAVAHRVVCEASCPVLTVRS